MKSVGDIVVLDDGIITVFVGVFDIGCLTDVRFVKMRPLRLRTRDSCVAVLYSSAGFRWQYADSRYGILGYR